jgi:hypothetical protein
MTADPILHVVFNRSAAASLTKTLELVGREEPVIGLCDSFGFGPIASDDPDDRVRWVEDVLGYAGWDEVVSDSALFLTASKSASALNAWVSTREAHTYAGYLWWLSNMRSPKCTVTNVPSLSITRSEDLVAWLDQGVALSTDELRRRQQQWRSLKADNSDLRIIVGDELVSKPLEWFDSLLLERATDQWQRMARIVGYALATFSEDGLYQVGDLFLGARLASLARAGVLEWRGDLGQMQDCELRLRS